MTIDKLTWKKKQHLDYLFNRFGNFEVTTNYNVGDQVMFGKWFSYESVMNNMDYIKIITHRSIFDCEVVLDHDKTSEQDEFVSKLMSSNYKYKLYTTHKNYHAHLIFPQLRGLDKTTRKAFKVKLIEEYKCDLGKASERCMIACEFALHWKRKLPKEIVYERLGNNMLPSIF